MSACVGCNRVVVVSRSEFVKRCLLALLLGSALLALFVYRAEQLTPDGDVFSEAISFEPLVADAAPDDAYPLAQLPPSDASALVNLSEFAFVVRPHAARDCAGLRPLILALIHSAPGNHERRAVLRNTWLARRVRHLVALFLLGTADDPLTRTILRKESALYGDLVQGNFVDSYHNMTYKHAMALKYAAYHCPGARYVVRADDDVVVNLDYLRRLLSTMSPYGVRNLLLCARKAHTTVLRSYRSKWRVSFSEYPAYSYPEYCSGGAVIYSPDVVFRIYKQVQSLPFFWIDDVHITGTAAKLAQVPLMHFSPDMNPFFLL